MPSLTVTLPVGVPAPEGTTLNCTVTDWPTTDGDWVIGLTDLEKMGIGVDVLTIQEISDEEEYLNALGKRRTAEVKRDATIGEAEAHRGGRHALRLWRLHRGDDR